MSNEKTSDKKAGAGKKRRHPRFIRREDHILEPAGPMGKLSARKPRPPRDLADLSQPPATEQPRNSHPTLAERMRDEGLAKQLRGATLGALPAKKVRGKDQ